MRTARGYFIRVRFGKCMRNGDSELLLELLLELLELLLESDLLLAELLEEELGPTFFMIRQHST